MTKLKVKVGLKWLNGTKRLWYEMTWVRIDQD